MAFTWTNSGFDTTSVDTWLNQSLYGGLGEADGIDLRIEMNRILYGGLGKKPMGHWVVLRAYDRSKPCSNYNKRTHESVGGPGYEYSDTLLRTRRVPVSRRSDQLDAIKAGITISDNYVYYFEWDVPIKLGYHIFELTLADHTNVPDPANLDFCEKYVIRRLHPYRLENGNVQYWAAVAEYDEIGY